MKLTNATDLATLEQALNYKFKSTKLIIEALTHRSHFHENKDSDHNERLEFLGDAVLDLCVTEVIMRLSPLKDEGHLSKLRSQIVSEASLARIARNMQLGRFVRLGKGEAQSGGRNRDSLLADTAEAVIAAIYLDGGLEAAKRVVSAYFDSESHSKGDWATQSHLLITRDHKSRLQEYCQKEGYGTPSYLCVESLGPDHMRKFTMALKLQGIEVIRSEGRTKKEATQRAAELLLLTYSIQSDKLKNYLAEMGIISKTSKIRNSEFLETTETNL